MADYSRVKIGSVWLTDGGDETDIPCRCEVVNSDQLKPARTGFTRKAMSGKPRNFTLENLREGIDLIIKPTVTRADVVDAIQAVFDTSLASDTAFNVLLSESPAGDYDLQCKVKLPEQIIHPDNYVGERMYGVEFHVTVDSVTPEGP